MKQMSRHIKICQEMAGIFKYERFKIDPSFLWAWECHGRDSKFLEGQKLAERLLTSPKISAGKMKGNKSR